MAVYEYNNAVSDLTNKYGQDQATQAYGRFLGQQRFGRQRVDMDRNFQGGFAKMAGGFARRGFGSKIQSGRVAADTADAINGYQRQAGQLDQEQAGFEGDWNMRNGMQDANYRAALQRLQEQLSQGQALSDPFAIYRNVWGA